MAAPTREEFDKGLELNAERIAHMESRIDAKLDIKFGEITTELARKPGTGTLIITGLVMAGTIIAVLAFGGDRFDGGVQVAAASVAQAQEAKALAEATVAQVVELKRQNDLIIQLLQNEVTQ